MGLHWVLYSWIIQHPLGIIHAILRAVLVVLACYSLPVAHLLAVSVAIVLVYCLSMIVMGTLRVEALQTDG